MTTVKISQLDVSPANLATTDHLVCNRSGTTERVTVSRLANSMGVGDTTIDTSTYTAAVGSNEYITMSNTSAIKAGMLVKFTQGGGATTYHLVKSVTTNTKISLSGLSIAGNGSIDANSFKILNDARGIPVDVVFSGSYCIDHASPTNTLIADENKTQLRWTGPTARLVYVAARTQQTDGGTDKPDINVSINGTTSAISTDLTLTAANTWYEVADGGMASASQVNFGEVIEVKLTDNGTDGDARDLTVSMVFAVEDF